MGVYPVITMVSPADESLPHISLEIIYKLFISVLHSWVWKESTKGQFVEGDISISISLMWALSWAKNEGA